MRLKVERKHIDAAVLAYLAGEPGRYVCPIAQACRDVEPGKWAVSPYLRPSVVSPTRAQFGLSRPAIKQARLFDLNRQFKPGTYVLTPITEEANK